MATNVTLINIEDMKMKHSSVSELYKKLETIDYTGLFERNEKNEPNSKIERRNSPDSSNNHGETQISVLRGSLKIVFLSARILGLFPVGGFFEEDVSKIRFSFLTWKSLYSLLMCFAQVMAAILCFYRLLNEPLSLSTIIFTCFYTSTSMTSVLCIKIASRWPALVYNLFESELDGYVDTRIKFKCKMISLTYIIISLVLHMLRVVDRVNEVLKCYTTDTDILKIYCEITYPWLNEFNLSYSKSVQILLVILNLVTVLVWFYPDLFIICVSLYLSSIIHQFNKNIASTEGKLLITCLHPQSFPSDYWRRLREDYNRITTVVRYFNNDISCLIFSTFTSNLFFVCFQVYYVLLNGASLSITVPHGSCPNYSRHPMYGYEHSIYFITLVIFMFVRYLVVSLCAAEINSASLMTSPYLYGIQTSVFCPEVQRFIDHVHGNTVALSGLNFFHVTREFVLSVFRTIITYELVLLQLNSSSIKLL